MAASLKGREFNIRVSFDENGEPVIGMVQGFYASGSNCVDIKGVPASVKAQIAKALGIRSGTDFTVNRLIAKSKAA